jgi:hypothetical protein
MTPQEKKMVSDIIKHRREVFHQMLQREIKESAFPSHLKAIRTGKNTSINKHLTHPTTPTALKQQPNAELGITFLKNKTQQRNQHGTSHRTSKQF